MTSELNLLNYTMALTALKVYAATATGTNLHVSRGSRLQTGMHVEPYIT